MPQPPEYEPVEHQTDEGWRTVPGVETCSVCGAAVADRRRHSEWHYERDQLDVRARMEMQDP